MPASERPLDGIAVLECAGIFAGPWTGTLMADLGAEVIEVEHPEYGDPLRDGLHEVNPGGHTRRRYLVTWRRYRHRRRSGGGDDRPGAPGS